MLSIEYPKKCKIYFLNPKHNQIIVSGTRPGLEIIVSETRPGLENRDPSLVSLTNKAFLKPQ